MYKPKLDFVDGFLIFLDLILPIFIYKHADGYIQKLEASYRIDIESTSSLDLFRNFIGVEKFILLYILFIISCIAFLAGGWTARSKIDFITVSNQENTVVLKSFNNNLVVTDVDTSTNTITGNFSLIQLDSGTVDFKVKTLGRLIPNSR